jgi:hypothetical protein
VTPTVKQNISKMVMSLPFRRLDGATRRRYVPHHDSYSHRIWSHSSIEVASWARDSRLVWPALDTRPAAAEVSFADDARDRRGGEHKSCLDRVYLIGTIYLFLNLLLAGSETCTPLLSLIKVMECLGLLSHWYETATAFRKRSIPSKENTRRRHALFMIN